MHPKGHRSRAESRRDNGMWGLKALYWSPLPTGFSFLGLTVNPRL